MPNDDVPSDIVLSYFNGTDWDTIFKLAKYEGNTMVRICVLGVTDRQYRVAICWRREYVSLYAEDTISAVKASTTSLFNSIKVEMSNLSTSPAMSMSAMPVHVVLRALPKEIQALCANYMIIEASSKKAIPLLELGKTIKKRFSLGNLITI